MGKFSIFNFEVAFFRLLQGFWIPILNFSTLNIHNAHAFRHFLELFSYVMTIVYSRFHLSDIFTKLGHFVLLKRNFSNDLLIKSSNVRIYFVASFLIFYSFQETRASSTTSCQMNRTDTIILNMFGVSL